MTSQELTIDDFVIRSSSHTPFFGVYLASHAIYDSLCMCHASVGCKVKTQYHLVGHEGIRSAHRRMRYSQFIDEDLINGCTKQLEEEIVAWQRRQDSQLVVIDPSTPISLQAQDHTGVVKRLEEKMGVRVIFVDTRNYENDLYSGYANTIGEILRRLDWETSQTRDDEVTLIGYPFDRYEADNHANVNELRRIMKSLGFKVPAFFLAGEPFDRLKKAPRAKSHLLMPYAHSQAKVLRKLKKEYYKIGWPMSVAGTTNWIRTVGKALKVEDEKVNGLIQFELTRLKPLLELTKKKISGAAFAVFSDAPRAAGIIATLMEAGMVPKHISVLHFDLGGRKEVEEMLASDYNITLPGNITWQENATPEEIRQSNLQECQLSVGTSVERALIYAPHCAWLELGFPSNNRHYIFPSPYLGYSGAVNLLQQVNHQMESLSRWGH